MWLSELLAGLVVIDQDMELTHIALDSREVTSGGVFFALAGSQQHGLQFAEHVCCQNAVAIVYDPAKQGEQLAEEITAIPLYAVPRLAEKLSELAGRFYGYPSEHLNVIGITGTNGKTSCSQYLAQILPESAVVGTLGWGVYPDLQQTVNTTPDAFSVQKILADLLAQGVKNVAMEVSSHGLQQGRVAGVKFLGVIFTNLSRDHLDYHGSMEAYLQSKMKLMQWPGIEFAVVNLDDAYAGRIIHSVAQNIKLITFSLTDKVQGQYVSVNAQDICYNLDGIACRVSCLDQRVPLKAPLLGDFNVQNLLAVLAVSWAMGVALQESVRIIAEIKPVAGRMECFYGGAGKPMVIVDYAHTPDALTKALTTLRQHCVGRLALIFGCGGDRDRGKRGEMGRVAERLADDIVITDDNPRFENGQSIINDIIANIKTDTLKVIRDRKTAIQHSIKMHSADDIILLAGKGHEQYQELKGVKHPFSDRENVQLLLAS